MNAVAGSQGEGGAGVARADFVLGDRDGTTCEPALTQFVRSNLTAMGYDVKVNDPFKGVALVQAYSDPAGGRHSLQIEINKRLYMDEGTQQRHAGFATLQQHLVQLVDALIAHAARGRPRRQPTPARLSAAGAIALPRARDAPGAASSRARRSSRAPDARCARRD